MIKEYLDYHFNLSARVEAFKQGKQYSCEIEVTNRCNFSCSYCYASANSFPVDFDAYFIKHILIDLWEYGIREIGWIGGEPLLHTDMFDLVCYARERGFQQAFYSNVSKFDPVMLKQYVNLIDRFIVHIDAIEYDAWARGQLHPSKSAFYSMMENVLCISRLLKDKSRLIVSVPLTKDCFESLEETIFWAKGLGVDFINLIPLTPLGRSDDQKKFITRNQIWEAMEMRARILEKSFLIELGIGEYCKQFQLTDFTINYKGDVLPYIDDFRSVGNVHENSITGILNSYGDKLRLKEWVSGDSYFNKAPGCRTCSFGKYCFGNPVSRENPSVELYDKDCVLS